MQLSNNRYWKLLFQYRPFLAICFMSVVWGGCAKQRDVTTPPIPLQLFNAMDDGVPLALNLNNGNPVNYLSSKIIDNKASVTNIYPISAPGQVVHFYAYPDTLVHNSPVFSMGLDLEPDFVYSLFFAGTKTSVDTVLVKEKLHRFSFTDTTIRLRVINLSNGDPINVNIKGKPNGSLAENLGYKKITGFTTLPADATVSEYVIEFKNQVTGVILETYAIPNFSNFTSRQKLLFTNHTLAFTGKPKGTGKNVQRGILISHR